VGLPDYVNLVALPEVEAVLRAGAFKVLIWATVTAQALLYE
jgi:hypothetical protein